MPPKHAPTDISDVFFLLSCLMNVDSISFADVAEQNGIAGSKALTPATLAQRKYKRIVDASGLYTLQKGKLVLKDQNNTSAITSTTTATTAAHVDDDDEVDEEAEAPKAPGKKRGRPAGARNKTNKKVKAATTEEADEEE